MSVDQTHEIDHAQQVGQAHQPAPSVHLAHPLTPPIARQTLARPGAGTGVQFLAVLNRTLSERRRALAGWSLGLVGIVAMQLAVYPSVAKSAENWQTMLEAWPKPLRDAFGLDAYTTGNGFLNAELISMMFPLVFTAVALGFASSATAGEEERGTADVLLALPIRRATVLTAKVTAMALGVLMVAAAGAIGVLVGAPMADLDVSSAGFVAATFMTAMLGLLFGSVGVLVGALTGRRGAALGVGLGLAIGAFLVDALAPMADWLEPWQKVSPFYWALHVDALSDGLDVGMAAALVCAVVALLGAALMAFQRRDINSR